MSVTLSSSGDVSTPNGGEPDPPTGVATRRLVGWQQLAAFAETHHTPAPAVVLAGFIATEYRRSRHAELVAEKLTVEVTPTTTFADLVRALSQAGPAEADGGLNTTVRPNLPDPGAADVSCALRGVDGEWQVEASCPTGTADASRWLAVFECLLADGMRRPEWPIERLLVVSPDEQRRLAQRINSGLARYGDLACLHHQFESVAARQPSAVAIESGTGTVTYHDLDDWANGLAAKLQAAGVGPESHVGICIPRSPAMVAAVLGVLKAGAAFVPLDTRFPLARIASIAADAPLALIMSDEAHLDELAKQPAPVMVTPVLASPSGAPRPPEIPIHLDRAAYTYYTSGSTGIPKGVTIDHRGAAIRLAWFSARYPLEAGEQVILKTPLIFDVAICEMFWPLAAGATILLADPDAESDASHLDELLRRPSVVFGHFVPSMLTAFLESAPSGPYPSLRWIQLSGEAVPTALLEKFTRHFDLDLHVAYGQTETSEVAFWEGRSASDRRVPLGQQVGIYRLFVVDPDGQLVPPGVPGELCVAGVGGLARGYLGHPGLTADRFRPNPFGLVPGERLYHTGDLAVAEEDGSLRFLGRVDSQVKIRGCRVELGEVESVLVAHPAVRTCAVVTAPGSGDSDQLVAYLATSEPGPTVDEIVQHAETHLPSYMLPADYVLLAELPLTASGKLDRGRLPRPTRHDREVRAGAGEPTTDLERALCALWADVLRVPNVGRDDNFFRIGGDSLRSLQMLNRVKATFQIPFAVREFFAGPTVANMAELITARVATPDGS